MSVVTICYLDQIKNLNLNIIKILVTIVFNFIVDIYPPPFSVTLHIVTLFQKVKIYFLATFSVP